MLAQDRQHFVSHCSMFLEVFCENKNIVHVDDDHPPHNEISEEIVHHRLECGGGIGKAEKHDAWLEQPTVRDKRCLPLISLSNADILIPPAYVKFGEVSGTT